MKQIYIEWRDAVGKGQYTHGDFPSSTLLQGTTWLVSEDENDILVAAYKSEDGGYMDMIAIPKSSIERREDVEAPHSSSPGGQQASPATTQSESPQ